MKMKYLDFSKNAIAWFKSYFSEQKFKKYVYKHELLQPTESGIYGLF